MSDLPQKIDIDEMAKVASENGNYHVKDLDEFTNGFEAAWELSREAVHLTGFTRFPRRLVLF